MDRHEMQRRIIASERFWFGGDPSLGHRLCERQPVDRRPLDPKTEAWLASIANDTVDHPDTQPLEEQGEK